MFSLPLGFFEEGYARSAAENGMSTTLRLTQVCGFKIGMSNMLQRNLLQNISHYRPRRRFFSGI